MVPTALRLATANCCSGATRAPAIWSRLDRAIVAWAARSIWPSPIEVSHCCQGCRIVGRWARIFGMESTNWAIDVVNAPAVTTTASAITMTTTV